MKVCAGTVCNSNIFWKGIKISKYSGVSADFTLLRVSCAPLFLYISL